MIIVVGSLALVGIGRQQQQSTDKITLPNGMALCSHFGIDQVPYLSAKVAVNGTSPLQSITAYVNGTFESTVSYSFNSTSYVTNFSINPPNPSMSILAGRTYVVVLTANFRDGSTASASSSVIAC